MKTELMFAKAPPHVGQAGGGGYFQSLSPVHCPIILHVEMGKSRLSLESRTRAPAKIPFGRCQTTEAPASSSEALRPLPLTGTPVLIFLILTQADDKGAVSSLGPHSGVGCTWPSAAQPPLPTHTQQQV